MRLTGNDFRRWLRVSASFAVVSGITAMAFIHPSPVAASSFAGIMIPLYTYPGSTWTSVIQAKQANPSVSVVAVINPNSGPGTAVDQNYASGIKQLEGAGVMVLGYDHTSYGARSVSDVEADAKAYSQWYGVNGIFFDEMASASGYETYYSTLTAYSRSLGEGFNVGNPGAMMSSSYLGIFTSLITYEDSGLPSGPLSYSSYGKSSFGVITYGVGLPSSSQVQTITNSVGWVYFTDAGLPNPYGSLPSYFAAEVALLAGGPTSSTSTTSGGISSSVTIQSTDLNGIAVTGYYSALYGSTGSVIGTGFTPTTFATTSGQSYSASVANYGSCSFSKWSDGVTSNPRPFTASSNAVTFSAEYSCGSSSTRTASTTSTTTTTTYTTTTTTYTTATSTSTAGGTGSETTVQSADQNGNPITGYYSVLYDPSGTVLKTGFTPASFATTGGQSYSARVDGYGSCSFIRWSDGISSNPRPFTASSSRTTLTAVLSCATTTTTTTTTTTAPPPPIPSYPVVVNAARLDGTPLSGEAYASIMYFQLAISQGYTPVTAVGTTGVLYTVSVSNFGNYVFDHWSDGSTNSSLSVTVNRPINLVAYFKYVKPHFPFTVTAKSLGGTDLAGMPVTVMANGSIITRGLTPFSFDTVSGASYTISVGTQGPYSFDHWNDGVKSPTTDVTSGGATTLVALYSVQHAFPITVDSASVSGSPIPGLWATVSVKTEAS